MARSYPNVNGIFVQSSWNKRMEACSIYNKLHMPGKICFKSMGLYEGVVV